MNHTVFISLPMSGLNDELVEANIERAKNAYLAITGMDILDVRFVDNLHCQTPFDEKISKIRSNVWRLGNALKILASCDEAFFWGDWKKARGCMIEHEVCTMYGIPVISVEQERGKHDT